MEKRTYLLVHSPGARLPTYVTSVAESGVSIFSGGLPPAVPLEAFISLPASQELTDRLLTAGNELILSERTFRILAIFNIDPEIVTCPLRTGLKGDQQLDRGAYHLLYSRRRHDVLDEGAVVRRIKGAVLSVFEWGVDVNKLPDYDLFLGPTNHWFFSERLAIKILAERHTGFGFALVPCFGD